MNKAVLIVLDGFGIGKNSPFNAIENARMPFYRDLLSRYPHSELITHGKAVGLPDGVMGNSEVGHMTMGAGRIIYQDLTRISNCIEDGSFYKNPQLIAALQAGAKNQVHLMGLLSDGGVHSHIAHLIALLDLSLQLQIPRIAVHAFLDGRDTPPNSGRKYVEKLLLHPAFKKNAKLASLSGRYYAMDRDNRWERVEKAFNVLTGQTHAEKSTPLQVIDTSYAAKITDEFLEPTLLDESASIADGDSVVFFNYRSDRARELTRTLTDSAFSVFVRKRLPKLSNFTCMATYDKNFNLPVAYGPQNLNHIFGEWLEERNLKQFKVAETEKYAHVTFFFNGGREAPFKDEDRILVPSPKDCATYDLKPEMSAFEVARIAAEKITAGKHDFTLMNFANADMVGHTGNYQAAVKALEALDQCLATVIGAAQKNDAHVLLTADHGNAEEMCDEHGQIHTQHTLNPVPALWIAPGSAIAPKASRVALQDGSLADIMPTLCEIMKLPLPHEVSGKSLIPRGQLC